MQVDSAACQMHDAQGDRSFQALCKSPHCFPERARAARILPESFPNEPGAQGENIKSLLNFGDSLGEKTRLFTLSAQQ